MSLDDHCNDGDFETVEPNWLFAPSMSLGVFKGCNCLQLDIASECSLTGKTFLTYTPAMVASSQREPDVFGAISHPARRRMLDLLANADCSVNAIAGHFEMSRPAVSQHLRILLDAGLVTEQRHGRERRYHFVHERLGPVRDWLAQYERFWDGHLHKLQQLLNKTAE